MQWLVEMLKLRNTTFGISLHWKSEHAGLKVASHPKCDHFGEKKKIYDGKVDLTPISVLKKEISKKILFLRELKVKIVFSSRNCR